MSTGPVAQWSASPRGLHATSTPRSGAQADASDSDFGEETTPRGTPLAQKADIDLQQELAKLQHMQTVLDRRTRRLKELQTERAHGRVSDEESSSILEQVRRRSVHSVDMQSSTSSKPPSPYVNLNLSQLSQGNPAVNSSSGSSNVYQASPRTSPLGKPVLRSAPVSPGGRLLSPNVEQPEPAVKECRIDHDEVGSVLDTAEANFRDLQWAAQRQAMTSEQIQLHSIRIDSLAHALHALADVIRLRPEDNSASAKSRARRRMDFSALENAGQTPPAPTHQCTSSVLQSIGVIQQEPPSSSRRSSREESVEQQIRTTWTEQEGGEQSPLAVATEEKKRAGNGTSSSPTVSSPTRPVIPKLKLEKVVAANAAPVSRFISRPLTNQTELEVSDTSHNSSSLEGSSLTLDEGSSLETSAVDDHRLDVNRVARQPSTELKPDSAKPQQASTPEAQTQTVSTQISPIRTPQDGSILLSLYENVGALPQRMMIPELKTWTF